jgi:hypothetical protein
MINDVQNDLIVIQFENRKERCMVPSISQPIRLKSSSFTFHVYIIGNGSVAARSEIQVSNFEEPGDHQWITVASFQTSGVNRANNGIAITGAWAWTRLILSEISGQGTTASARLSMVR